MSVVASVSISGSAALERALRSSLRQQGSAGGSLDASGAVPEAFVFAPAGPKPGREREQLRDALEAATAAGRRGFGRVVIVSSAAVYGASPYMPGFVDETWEPPATHPNTVAAWWRQLEEGGRRAFQSASVTVLRPAPVLDGESYMSRLCRGSVAVTLAGYDPSIQLLSVRDLAAAIRAALAGPPGGVYNVAPAGVIPLRAALQLAARRRVALPRLWQRPIRAALSRVSAASPADELEYIRYSSTTSGQRIARELGFTPSQSSADALLEFAGRAPSGDSVRTFDPFGQDKAYIAAYGRTLFRFLSDYYWRIEAEGVEFVPAAGRAVLSGPHRGFMPFDGVMLLHLVIRGRGRYVRFLIHPSLVKFPYLFNFMTKLGGVPACRENADWILGQDEIAGVFPEGIHGAFTPYRDAYRLGKFGRDEFVRMALRNRAPIVPFATVGSAEIFPILAKVRWSWWERWTDWPYFPITPTFPVAPVPLPSKWHVRFLEPLHVERDFAPDAADDPRVVREVSNAVRARIQSALDDMLSRRRWIFFGSIFGRSRDARV